MNILAAIRRRHRVWIPKLGAPLAVVWLSMLWQPCAVAMDMHTNMDMGAGMHMSMDMDHEQHACPHCPPSMHEDCGSDATEACEYLDRFDTDRRTSKTKIDDDSTDLQLVLLTSHESQTIFSKSSLPSALKDHATAPPGPPLNLLFCVYLI